MIRAGELAAFPPGTTVRLEADPPIMVIRTPDGAFFALDDTCSHQDASLCDGWVDGAVVTCPLHEAQFELRTGTVARGPARRGIRTHDVVIDGDEVYIVESDQIPNLPPVRRRIARAS